MKGLWGKNLSGEMNVSLAFTLDFEKPTDGEIQICGADCFKVYSDKNLIYFGPSRAAHGYARVAKISFSGKRLTVVVHCNNVYQFCWIKQQPFFACEITADGKTYTAEDFTCYRISDRVQKVQRYSFQRGFSEVYRENCDFNDFLSGKEIFEKVDTEQVEIPKLLPTYNANPLLNPHKAENVIEKGGVIINPLAEVWRDRVHYIDGERIQGFKIDEWEVSATDEASKFVFAPGAEGACELRYANFDFGRSITGFFEAEVSVKKGSVLYLLFDEILWDEEGKGKNNVYFARNGTSNVVKWTFTNDGVYHISTFDPYTLRYAVLIFNDVDIKNFVVRDYENPLVGKFEFSCADKRITKIVEAARATLAQNSVDILTDCPQRERAGWLSDSWFSSLAERTLTGGNIAEKTFLENYVLASKRFLPEGMVPMCYPADHPDTVFIPNWAMWYIAELYKYWETYGNDDLIEKSKQNVMGVIDYFKDFENEFGLLENLKSWVFVEWSEANDIDHIRGVNIPTNALYAYSLYRAGQLYGDESLIKKAQAIRAKIRELAFNGKFFVDNLVRNANGELVQNNKITEVCQYYLFRFYCLDKTEYSALYRELMDNLGTNRKQGYLDEVTKPNMMYGMYMRLDLLDADGVRKEILDECLTTFEVMANRTGTLWENLSPEASCNHGFAAYALRWIIFAISGYDILRNRLTDGKGEGIDCHIKIPMKDGSFTEITVKDGKTTVKELR